jgi:succinate dehydrogenase hydrophobic anchor subunit
MFTLQRYTGLVAFVFIGWHFYTERLVTGGRSTYETVYADLQNPLFLTFFAIGILCSSFHLGVGIWEFSLQVGTGRKRLVRKAPPASLAPLSESRSALWGILILISFRFDWHPFSSYITK